MNNLEDINYPAPKHEYKVLVRCFTYNQSKYIKDALDGFAMQQTNFPYVCLVMDDASTDGEQEVIISWMRGNCDMDKAAVIDIPTSEVVIVPLKSSSYCTFAFYLLKRNLYGTDDKKKHMYPWREKCIYEALCEGDDYWIDPLKLQKQVEFLENNPDYSMCFHNAIVHWDNREFQDVPFARIENRDYTGEEIYENWVVPTASVVFRVSVYDDVFRKRASSPDIIFGDIILFLSLVEIGKIRGFSDIMSVYRRHEGGAVYGVNIQRIVKKLKHDKFIGTQFSHKYEKISRKIMNFSCIYLSCYYLSRFSIFKSIYYLLYALRLDFFYSFYSFYKLIH